MSKKYKNIRINKDIKNKIKELQEKFDILKFNEKWHLIDNTDFIKSGILNDQFEVKHVNLDSTDLILIQTDMKTYTAVEISPDLKSFTLHDSKNNSTPVPFGLTLDKIDMTKITFDEFILFVLQIKPENIKYYLEKIEFYMV
ncbi:MAG: hypothetical protein K9H48_07900 [Melioribacteraceae bacterium]|nr:hypothetical protein [Melioribacteraceae bacterium]